MVNVRKVQVRAGDTAQALRAARYSLERSEAPDTYAQAAYYTAEEVGLGPGEGTRANSIWLGTEKMLAAMGVEWGSEVSLEQLALALQGKSAEGEVLRRPGMSPERDKHGNPVLKNDKKSYRKVYNHVELCLGTPKSLGTLWAAAGPELKAKIELAVLRAGNEMLAHAMGTKRVVAHEGGLVKANGFAASVSLQVTARRARGEEVPSPHLHLHCVVVGAERPDGKFAAPDSWSLYRGGTPLELAAVGRGKLAEELVEIGLPLVWGTGRGGRFFEIAGVPEAASDEFSARTKEVEAWVAAAEARTGEEMDTQARSRGALETRQAKESHDPRVVLAKWAGVLERHHFGPGRAEALLGERGFKRSLEERLREARELVLERFRERGPTVSPGEAAAIVYECGATRLRNAESAALGAEMMAAGEIVALAGGRMTSGEIRAAEERVIAVARRRAARGTPLAAAAVAAGKAAAARDLGAGKALDKEQLEAVDQLSDGRGWGILTGRAGTGKGEVLNALAAAYREEGWRVIPLAVEGLTAQELAGQLHARAREGEERVAYSLAMLRDHLGRGWLSLGGPGDQPALLIVDEASKVSLEDYELLAELAGSERVRVLLAGHEGQHQAIRGPGMFTALVNEEALKPRWLNKIRRHKDPEDPSKPHPWLIDYQVALDEGRGEDAVRILRKNKALRVYRTRELKLRGMVAQWDEDRRRFGNELKGEIMILHGSNQDVDKVNVLAQERRMAARELGKEGVAAIDCPYQLHPGDFVIVRESSYQPRPGPGEPRPRRVENGTRGIVKSVEARRERMVVTLSEPGADPREVEFDLADLRRRHRRGEKVAAPRLAYAYHAYAITGQTVNGSQVAIDETRGKITSYPADTRSRYRMVAHVDNETLGRGRTPERRLELLARKIVKEHRRQASIAYPRAEGERGGFERAEARALTAPPLRGQSERSHRRAARHLKAGLERQALRPPNPLAEHRWLGKRRAHLLARRAEGMAPEMERMGSEALRVELAAAREALQGVDRAGALETLRLQAERAGAEQVARAAAARAERLAQGQGQGRRRGRERHQEAEAERETARREGERERALGAAEERLRGEGRHLDDWLLAEGETLARWAAIRRELWIRRELAIAGDLAEALAEPSERLLGQIGERPEPKAPEREGWESLATAIERDRLLAEREPESEPDRERRELGGRIRRWRAERGMEPLAEERRERERGGGLEAA